MLSYFGYSRTEITDTSRGVMKHVYAEYNSSREMTLRFPIMKLRKDKRTPYNCYIVLAYPNLFCSFSNRLYTNDIRENAVAVKINTFNTFSMCVCNVCIKENVCIYVDLGSGLTM
jgi:hypothetical protein